MRKPNASRRPAKGSTMDKGGNAAYNRMYGSATASQYDRQRDNEGPDRRPGQTIAGPTSNSDANQQGAPGRNYGGGRAYTSGDGV